jgi:hypothetical protein
MARDTRARTVPTRGEAPTRVYRCDARREWHRLDLIAPLCAAMRRLCRSTRSGRFRERVPSRKADQRQPETGRIDEPLRRELVDGTHDVGSSDSGSAHELHERRGAPFEVQVVEDGEGVDCISIGHGVR